jgi:hypothetical protein
MPLSKQVARDANGDHCTIRDSETDVVTNEARLREKVVKIYDEDSLDHVPFEWRGVVIRGRFGSADVRFVIAMTSIHSTPSTSILLRPHSQPDTIAMRRTLPTQGRIDGLAHLIQICLAARSVACSAPLGVSSSPFAYPRVHCISIIKMRQTLPIHNEHHNLPCLSRYTSSRD